MLHRFAPALAVLLFLAAAVPAWAQDELLQQFYAGEQNSIRAEYESLLSELAGATLGLPSARTEKTKERLKLLSYNKAALFAGCAADTERDRSSISRRVPAENNLLLQTCVETKLGQLNKFSETVAYAEFFFPERIGPCGESSRLREQEKLLRPYDFLFLDEPRLYDFARYNDCLMKRP
jgi:hypothetical protein